MVSRVYLDYAATAPLSEDAAQAMHAFVHSDRAFWGVQSNANSLHSEGREAFRAMEEARASIARILKVRPHELVFTSGATEANNTALFGLLQGALQQGSSRVPHILTSTIEHDAVYKAAKYAESLGLCIVDYAKPERSGHISPEAFKAAIHADTVLASVIMGHNETGALNDICTLARIAHDAGVLFHTDAVQVLGKMSLDLEDLSIDAASFSAHKIGGPKGVGLLYVRSGCKLKPLLVGGGQESGMRSGTQNVAGMVGFAGALQGVCVHIDFLEQEAQRQRALRDKLYACLCALPGVSASVPCAPLSLSYLPHIVNVCVEGVESETLILQCDMRGFSVSGGSACSSASLEPSRSLVQIGIPRDLALGSLRISIGPDTTEADIDSFIDVFSDVLHFLQ